MNRILDECDAMYRQLRVIQTIPLARPVGQADVTRYPAPTHAPTEPPTAPLLVDVHDDLEYDTITDREQVVEGEACYRSDPAAIRRRATMAEDFSEGKLETLVDSPQKELPGT